MSILKKLFGRTKFENLVEELIHIGYTIEMIHPGRFFSRSNRIALDPHRPPENSVTYEKDPRVIAIGLELNKKGGVEMMRNAAQRVEEVLGVTATDELQWVWKTQEKDFLATRSKETSRLIDNGDGTVTDNKTKLIWQKEDDGQKKAFKESEAYCKTLTLGGYKDWRLPTINELRSVSHDWKQIFANPKDDEPYWSSTMINNPGWEPIAGEKAKYIVNVLFSDGSENNYFPHYKYYTRAVRQK